MKLSIVKGRFGDSKKTLKVKRTRGAKTARMPTKVTKHYDLRVVWVVGKIMWLFFKKNLISVKISVSELTASLWAFDIEGRLKKSS